MKLYNITVKLLFLLNRLGPNKKLFNFKIETDFIPTSTFYKIKYVVLTQPCDEVSEGSCVQILPHNFYHHHQA